MRSTRPSRRSGDPRRGGPPGAARGAAARRVRVRREAGRGAAGRALRDQPHAGPRSAAPAGGGRGRGPWPLPRAAAEPAARVGDARALRRARRARGPRRPHRRLQPPGRADRRVAGPARRARRRARLRVCRRGLPRGHRPRLGQQRDRALHPGHQRAHPADPDPRLHDAGPDRGDDRGAPRDPGDRPRRPGRRRRRADARAHRAQRRGRGTPRRRAARPHVRRRAWPTCCEGPSAGFRRSEGAPMSIATTAFAAALERLEAQDYDPPERPPAYDVFGPPAAPLPALGGLPRTGAIAAAARALDAGTTTCVALCEQALERIAGDEWTAFVEVCAEAALAEAGARDAELAAGRRRGPLHGIPVSVKDVIDVRGVRTRCGSDAYDDVPVQDADGVDLWRSAGAVILGKTSTHEFALGVTSPQARNPHDPTRIPGGSSGGSAIAVATGMGLASLGTDTRASIRVPAALCGVVGLKPTYGTVPTRGVVPLSWTMDHVAVMAATAEDAALALDALRPGAASVAAAAGARTRHLRLARPTAAWDGAEDAVVHAVDAALARL